MSCRVVVRDLRRRARPAAARARPALRASPSSAPPGTGRRSRSAARSAGCSDDDCLRLRSPCSVISVASAGPCRPRCTDATSGLVDTASQASVPAARIERERHVRAAEVDDEAVSAAGARPFTSAGVAGGGAARVRRLLVRKGDRQQPRLAPRRAEQLDADRHAVVGEPGRHADRRQSGARAQLTVLAAALRLADRAPPCAAASDRRARRASAPPSARVHQRQQLACASRAPARRPACRATCAHCGA